MTTHLWADDLTGAAELADAVRTRTGGARVALTTTPTSDRDVVLDLDARHLDRVAAYRRLDAALGAIAATDRVAYKIDSQLHGPIDAYLAAFEAQDRKSVV